MMQRRKFYDVWILCWGPKVRVGRATLSSVQRCFFGPYWPLAYSVFARVIEARPWVQWWPTMSGLQSWIPEECTCLQKSLPNIGNKKLKRGSFLQSKIKFPENLIFYERYDVVDVQNQPEQVIDDEYVEDSTEEVIIIQEGQFESQKVRSCLFTFCKSADYLF